MRIITKTYPYNFEPLKSHFYIVKLGFTGVYIICLISAQNIDCGYSLEPPRRGGFKRVPTIYDLSRNMKNIKSFLSENFQLLEVKFSIYLNRLVFVMKQRMDAKVDLSLLGAYVGRYVFPILRLNC